MPAPSPSTESLHHPPRAAAPGPRGDFLLGSYRDIARAGQVQFYLGTDVPTAISSGFGLGRS